MTYREIMKRLKSLENMENIPGMTRFGITPEKTFGIRIPELRKIAKEAGTDHELASKLWEADYRETKILASIIDDPAEVTREQLEHWVSDFDYWEIVDQCCMNLFEKMESAYDNAETWSSREEEFVRRAGYSLMARLAVSDKKATDDKFEYFMPLIVEGSNDERNAVKKSVNWALRQIGKRNMRLHAIAIETADNILEMKTGSARWIATDALRELRSESVINRLKKREQAARGI